MLGSRSLFMVKGAMARGVMAKEVSRIARTARIRAAVFPLRTSFSFSTTTLPSVRTPQCTALNFRHGPPRHHLLHQQRHAGTISAVPQPRTISAAVENALRFRPRTWFLSGILFACLGALTVIMSSRDYIAYTDAESLTAYTPTHPSELETEAFISSHPLTQSLRANPAYTESRPALKINPAYRSASLTSGTLLGPGRIVVPPHVWQEADGKSLVEIFYLGEDLCGHPGLVHGGLLATLLDEGLAKCCFPALPNRIAMTARLTVNYRKPSPAGSYMVLRAETVKVEGRKAWVEGRIETLPMKEGEEPVVLVEASALMIEPKQAKLLTSLIPLK